MILGWIRLAAMVLIGTTIAYFLLVIYYRSLRREALENEWEASDRLQSQQEFVENGMQAYEKGLKRRLLWLIYILPMAAFTAIFVYVNRSGF